MALSRLRIFTLSSNGLSALKNIHKSTVLSTDGMSAGIVYHLDHFRSRETTNLQSTVSISIVRGYLTHIYYHISPPWIVAHVDPKMAEG